MPGSAAAQAGLQPGDVIRRFCRWTDNPDWDKVYQRFNLNAGQQTVPVTVNRDGSLDSLGFAGSRAVERRFRLGPQRILSAGADRSHRHTREVQPGTPAEQAGLRGGDGILSLWMGTPFTLSDSLLAYMQDGTGKAGDLVIVRNGAALPPDRGAAGQARYRLEAGLLTRSAALSQRSASFGKIDRQVDALLQGRLDAAAATVCSALHSQGCG